MEKRRTILIPQATKPDMATVVAVDTADTSTTDAEVVDVVGEDADAADVGVADMANVTDGTPSSATTVERQDTSLASARNQAAAPMATQTTQRQIFLAWTIMQSVVHL